MHFHRTYSSPVFVTVFLACSLPLCVRGAEPEPSDAARFRDDGDELYQKGHIAEAIESYTKSLDVSPDASVLVMRAFCWKDLGELDKAIADCDAAIDHEPTLARAFMLRGYCRDRMHDVNRALADVTKAIDLLPKEPDPFIARANMWYRLGKYDFAKRDLDAAIKLGPKNAYAYITRAVVQSACANWCKAEADARKAIELDPERVDSRIMLAECCREQWKFAEALENYDQALKLNDQNDSAHHTLARFLATCPDKDFRDYDRALRHAKKACELTQWHDARRLMGLATVYAASGNFTDAQKWQKKALEITPQQSKSDAEKTLKLYEAGKTSSDRRR